MIDDCSSTPVLPVSAAVCLAVSRRHWLCAVLAAGLFASEKFDKEELDAIQWDSLGEEMSRSMDYQVVASYDELNAIYNAVKRG